jgi:hypothetical protein
MAFVVHPFRNPSPGEISLARAAALQQKVAMNFAKQYELVISWVVGHCPYPDKFAHSYAGCAIWLVAAIVLNKPLRSIWPLAVVVAAEVGNECIDRIAHGSWMWPDTLGDAAATWFWPVVITLALRQFPRLRR